MSNPNASGDNKQSNPLRPSDNRYQIDGDAGEETRLVQRGDQIYEQRVSSEKRSGAQRQRTEGPERTSSTDEPVVQFSDSARFEGDAEIAELKARILNVLLGRVLSPSRLRQLARVNDYALYNRAIRELLDEELIEQRRGVTSELASYAVVADENEEMLASGVPNETPGEPLVRFEEENQAIGEQVPVLTALQDFVGLAVDVAKHLEDIRDGHEVVDSELMAGLSDLVLDALDYLNGYENPRGKWICGVVDLLEWFRESIA